MVALEIMASATALINTKIPELPKWFRITVPCQPENVQELAGALERIIGDKSLREELGRKGRERAREFTWDRISSEWLDYAKYVLSVDSRTNDLSGN